MKNLIRFITISATTFFMSCSPTIMTLKGSYLDKPFEVISDKPIESVWSNIIDLFAIKGLSIKIIDKSSGLIVSENSSFMSSYTFEDNNGKLLNPEAWIVLNRIQYMGGDMLPGKLTGAWNVRVKSTADGKTLINVNLTNIEATKYVPKADYVAERYFVFNARSTGKFEQSIVDLVK